MKGIILAGGTGSRLYPLTRVVCKQLLPVYDKPMIYYPLSVLMMAGIRDILIISSPDDLNLFRKVFNDGAHLGINVSYAEQKYPKGVADSLIIGSEFVGKDPFCLVLGDNIFHGDGLVSLLKKAVKDVTLEGGATLFGSSVSDPCNYGVVEFDEKFQVVSIEEKPKNPKSNYAVTGLYFYDNSALEIVKSIKPSKRGELEITDVNKAYLEKSNLRIELLGRGYAWLDSGTYENLIEASQYISIVEKRLNIKIACIEEIAYKFGYINKEQLMKLADPIAASQYGKYLISLL